jgi:uncharacterized protein
MVSVDRRTNIEILDRDECLRRLQDDVIGRIAIVAHGVPLVLPVNYALDGDSVVFRTGEGSKLAAVGRGPACFEIDGFDRASHGGWSVLVQGHLEELTVHRRGELDRLRELPVDPWIPDGRDHWLRLVATRITGRCVRGRAAETTTDDNQRS